MKKICRWDPSEHNNKRCPFHSVRQNEDGLYEETLNGGKDWEVISSSQFDEMKESLANNEIDLNDLEIEFNIEETFDERMGVYDKVTNVFINGEPIVTLSTIDEDRAIKELSEFLKDEMQIEVSEEEIKNALVEVNEK